MSAASFFVLALAFITFSSAVATPYQVLSVRTATAVRVSQAARNITVSQGSETNAGGPNSFAGRPWSKRGVGFDFWNDGDKWTNTFTSKLENNKISWAYNWDSAPSPNWPSGDNFNRGLNFVPMLWCPGNIYPQHTEKWNRNIEQMIQAGAKELLGFNEPDMCEAGAGGSCVPDANEAAQKYAQYTSPFRNRGLRFGSPGVTSTQRNPNMGLPWLRSFLDNCNRYNCKIDIIPIHWYGKASEAEAFLKHVSDAADLAAGRPIWITEFGFEEGSAEEQVNFFQQVLPQLDRDNRVERYAFHKASRPQMFNNDGTLSLVGWKYSTI